MGADSLNTDPTSIDHDRMNVLRLIQFTDPHLYADEAGTLRGIATYPALMNAIGHARAREWPPRAVLLTGDLVQDDPGGYATVRKAFDGVGVPVLCLPGNHDIPQAMRQALNREPFILGGHVDFGCWRIVLLDSCVPGSADGQLSAAALTQLDRSLASSAGKHVLVCLHHHPVPMASRWLDRVGLTNPEQLFSRIDAHRNVRGVLWGHVHQSYDGLRRNVRLLATPSTCAQFLPLADEFAIDSRPPAYRTLELKSDGTIVTEVVWLDASSSAASSSSALRSA